MATDDSPRTEPCEEFRSALEKLNRLFAGALHDAKFNSCWSAWLDIRRTKGVKKKTEIFSNKFEEWREGSANAVQKWLPKFVDLATANPEVVDSPIQWTKDVVWNGIEGICGITRPKKGELLPSDRGTNRIVVWWFAVASQGDPEALVDPARPWISPPWLARNRRKVDELVEKHSGYLLLRLNRVIEDEISLAEIRRASNRRLAGWENETSRSGLTTNQRKAANRRPPQIDPRKELIGKLKLHNVQARARRICELIDEAIEKSGPIRQSALSPRQEWIKLAPGTRSWVDVYDSKQTHERVRGFVNKVPAQKTSK